VVDYLPATANRNLMTDILRDKWGFGGVLITDYTCIMELEEHGLGDVLENSVLAIKAGVEMDMAGETLMSHLPMAFKSGLVTQEEIDRACRRVLQAKEKLGLFDDPYRYFNEARAATEILSQENRKFAREVAAETFVLLKNENNLLPLAKDTRIALVGPLADSRRNMMGTWSVSGDHDLAITVREGIYNVLGGEDQVLYAKGANISDDPEFAKKVNAFGPEIVIDERSPQDMIWEAVDVAMKSDVVVAVVGEAADMNGEASSMADIGLRPSQRLLLEALIKTGKPIVMVLYSGRPMTLPWENEKMDAILGVWAGGIEGGNAVADVLFGDREPGGRLTASFPVHVGQIPVYHSMLSTGRPTKGSGFKFLSRYLDIPNEPLFPFGYGMAYTTFSYGEPVLDRVNMTQSDTLSVSITVTNTGSRAGSDVVQMYIRDVMGSISRPVMELKGFEKIRLDPGESRTLTFRVHQDLLSFYNYELEWVAEPGDFEIMIGPNAGEVQTRSFTLIE